MSVNTQNTIDPETDDSAIQVLVDPAVFNEAYLSSLHELASLQIYFGGSSSGKSRFLSQRCVLDVLRGGRNYLVCRKVADTLRKSVWNEIKKVIDDFGLGDLFIIGKSEFVITCINGYQILFTGLDDAQKIKSITPAKGVITDLWVEEATEISRTDLKELSKRLRGGSDDVVKRIVLSFNPILRQHWIFKDYFEKVGWTDTQTEYVSPTLYILKTTYKDNRFLTAQDVTNLEDEADPYFYSVYTLGNWGVLGNVIFKNWRVEDLSTMMNEFTNTRSGADFGYADDPAAWGHWHYDKMRKRIYFFDEIYETGLSNPEFADRMKDHGIGKDRVVCDSAEPKSIRELRDNGINAVPSKKGKDSVNFGIQWLQSIEIIVDVKCINMQNELSQYHWKEDRGGNVIPVPVDRLNHLIDELRYGSEEDMTVVRKARSMPRVSV